MTGLGIGGVTTGGLSGIAGAQSSACAEGPFERTYEGGTVSVGQIRAEQARAQDGERGFGTASPGARTQSAGSAEDPGRPDHDHWGDGTESLDIGAEYEGVGAKDTRGGVPSDSQIAAGHGKVLQAVNRQIAIYNKRSGKRQRLFSLERLWEPVIDEPEGGFENDVPLVFDPRVRYDRDADRFVVCATQFQAGITDDGEIIGRDDLESDIEPEADTTQVTRQPRGWFLVAVSATPNPNGKWYVYRIPPLENRGLVDYPTLGLDHDAIYMAQNFFPEVEGLSFDVTMVTLDKEAMYEGRDVTAYHFNRMNDPDSDGITFTVQPALQPFSGGRRGTYYLVNSDFPTPESGTLTLWELTDPLDEPSLECHTLDVPAYSTPPNARQPGSDSRIDTLGTRVMNADYARGSLWTAHSLAVDWSGNGTPVSGIAWYEIDVESRSVAQRGVYGAPGQSYFIPTVGATPRETIVTHNVSGPETYVRMDVAGRTAHYTRNELEDAVVVEEGASPYDALEGDVERWGDYNGVSIDPRTGRFWTVSQYSPDVDIPVEDEERDPYATRIAEIGFDDRRGRNDDRGRGRDDDRGRDR